VQKLLADFWRNRGRVDLVGADFFAAFIENWEFDNFCQLSVASCQWPVASIQPTLFVSRMIT
jgi:hypothetical protein